MRLYAQALCYFWRAKLYHSEYLVDRHYLLTKPSSSPTPASPTSYKSIGGIGAGAGRDRRAAQEPDHAADARGNDGGGDRSDGDGDGDGDAEIDALYRKAAYASSTSSSLNRPSFLFGSSHAAMQRNAGMGYG